MPLTGRVAARTVKGFFIYMASSKNELRPYQEDTIFHMVNSQLERECICLPTGAEKHHWSYNDEHFKDVIWLSKKEHNKAHRFIVYDQERKMYRNCFTNVLLDTKQSHETFIKYCITNQED